MCEILNLDLDLDTVEAIERGENDILGEELVDTSISASFIEYMIWITKVEN